MDHDSSYKNHCSETESLLQRNTTKDSHKTRPLYQAIVKDHCVDNSKIKVKTKGFKHGSLIDKIYPSGFLKEAKSLLQLVVPLLCTQLCNIIIGPISVMFCGHLGNEVMLDGAALAISMIDITCIAVGQGLGTACDTFFSQTYGSENKKKTGVHLQKAVIIFNLAILPCYALQINLETLLVAMGQDPEPSRLAGQYIVIFMPGALGFFMYTILSKYIQSQNIVIPNVVIGLIVNIINAVLHYIFLYKLKWGTNGSAVALSVSFCLLFLFTLLYILVSQCYVDTWDGWSTECLHDWGPFVKICISGILLVSMEGCGFEVGVLITGLLGKTELGAQSVLLQLETIWFQVPLSIQIACAIRVGQYLGAGQDIHAKSVARLAISLAIFLAPIFWILCFTLRYKLPYLFTNIESVAKLTSSLLPIIAVYVFFDGIAASCKGVLFGTGRQKYGAVVLFVSFYILALPTAIYLMFFTDMKSAGYWWATAGNLVLQSIILLTITMNTDWNKQVQKAQERAGVKKENTKKDEPNEEEEDMHRTILLSASLNAVEVKAIVKPNIGKLTWKLVLKRLLAVLLIVSILVAAVIVKVFVKDSHIEQNMMYQRNSSLVDYRNYTTQATAMVSSFS